MEERPIKKKKKHRLRFLAWLLLLVPVAYISVQMVQVLRTNYQTQTAIAYTMSDTVLCDGMLAMQEITVPLDGVGVLGYQADNGERVSAGSEIARLFANEAGAQSRLRAEKLTEELALLERSQQGINGTDVEALLNQTQQGVYAVLDGLQSENYTGLDAARAEIQLAQNKLLLVTGAEEDFAARTQQLTEQRDAADAASSYAPVYAPATGYFVSAQDSEKQLYAPEALAAMSPAELQQALKQPPAENEASIAGKLILDYRWRYYALVTAKQAGKFAEGLRVELSFPNISAESLPATVTGVSVDEEAGIAKVELLCDYINDTVVTLEHEKAEITFATYDGIRIDRRALHIVDGKNCVYVQFGNVVYLRYITILFEDEDYILVPSSYTKEENEIKLFDQIVVQGSDLYDEKILSSGLAGALLAQNGKFFRFSA